MKLPPLRPYRDSDHAGVLALIGEIYRNHGFELDLVDIDAHLNDPGTYFRDHGGDFWVAEHQGRLVATISLLVEGEHVELKSLYVHPDYRRNGWGGELTLFVERRTLELGLQRVELWSDTRFEAAHRLYRRLGYTQEGVRHFDDVNNTSEYGFYRELGGA